MARKVMIAVAQTTLLPPLAGLEVAGQELPWRQIGYGFAEKHHLRRLPEVGIAVAVVGAEVATLSTKVVDWIAEGLIAAGAIESIEQVQGKAVADAEGPEAGTVVTVTWHRRGLF